jgi:hypothetical protein
MITACLKDSDFVQHTVSVSFGSQNKHCLIAKLIYWFCNKLFDFRELIAVFMRMCKIVKRAYWLPHVCNSVRMEILCSHQMDFCEIWYLTIFRQVHRENSSFVTTW